MVHRSADSRLLINLLQQEKDYSKQLGQIIEFSNASLASFAAYAAASSPPTSHIIMDIAGALAGADEALRMYAKGVDEWREAMRALKDAEEEVGNIMRDREILVTRLIKASKPTKTGSGSIRESLLLSNQRFPSSSSLSLSASGQGDSPSPPPSRPLSSSFSSTTKLAAAQAELQACETHLASKERELSDRRNATIRDGMGIRMRAMVECGNAWSELGKSALHSLEQLHADSGSEQRPSAPLQLQESDSFRPSLDFSSIGPSQSASQIGHTELPPPVSMTAVMNSVLLGNATRTESGNEQTDTHGQRPPSHQSSVTTSSIFSTPAVPATYQIETVTYAPAIAVHVAGKDGSTPPVEPRQGFPSIPMPAPHALEGYAYDIPTATNEAGDPSRMETHSRSNSGYSTPQAAGQNSVIPMRHVLERRITEDSQEERRANSREQSEVSSLEEIKDERKLVEEGKLALVENPRFMSEARRREIENEKQKQKGEEMEKYKKEKGKERDVSEATPVREREKKRFGLFQSSKHDRGPVQDHPAVLASTPEATHAVDKTASDKGSPSKGFLGGLRGLFGGKSPSASGHQSLFRTPIVSPHRKEDQDSEDREFDSDTEVSPAKGQSKGLQGLFRPSEKSRAASSSGRWETRTDKNLKSLTRQRSYDEELVKPPPNKYGGGLAGATVAQAGIVNATGLKYRTRTSSDVNVSASRDEGQATSGGRRLKKARAAGQPASNPMSSGNALHASTSALTAPAITQRSQSASMQTPVESSPAKPKHRRSASVDPKGNRKSWTEPSDVEGDGMIVDLGRRRRVASEVGVMTPAQTLVEPRKTNSAVGTALPQRKPDIFEVTTQHAQGYSSDTVAGKAGTTGVTKKKSLSKKRAPEVVPSAAPLYTISAPPSVVTNNSAVSAPMKKATPIPPVASAVQPTQRSAQTGTATVLMAGGEKPSGVLKPQRGWDAHAQAPSGGLSRNNSVLSAVSAPSGGISKSKKSTTLGHGMGGGGGVARRASLTGSAPMPIKGEAPASGTASQPPVFQPLQPALNLMSIVEDVARTNREGWQQGKGKSHNIEVVKAPPAVGRSTLEALVPSDIRHLSGSSTTTLGGEAPISSRTGMFEIKAPGSVFDQRKETDISRMKSLTVDHSFRSGSPKATEGNPLHAPHDTRISGKAPLRSALRNSSRSPSPATGHALVHRAAGASGHDGIAQPPPVNGALPWGSDGTLKQPRKVDQGKSIPVTEDVDPSGDSSSEVFYSDLEEYERETVPPPVSVAKAPVQPSSAKPNPKMTEKGGKAPATVGMNGHADSNVHPGKTPSELSHSSNSTYVGSALRSGVEYVDATPRRRKSVRVSLQPTFSPSPPAIEEDDVVEQRYQPWASPQDGRQKAPAALPAPIPVRAAGAKSPTVAAQLDIWADSSDEDEQYAKAKRLLSRAAKKEKNVSLLVANRGQ